MIILRKHELGVLSMQWGVDRLCADALMRRSWFSTEYALSLGGLAVHARKRERGGMFDYLTAKAAKLLGVKNTNPMRIINYALTRPDVVFDLLDKDSDTAEVAVWYLDELRENTKVSFGNVIGFITDHPEKPILDYDYHPMGGGLFLQAPLGGMDSVRKEVGGMMDLVRHARTLETSDANLVPFRYRSVLLSEPTFMVHIDDYLDRALPDPKTGRKQ